MSTVMERWTGRSPLFPELFDWLESGLFGMPMPRMMPGLHNIRIEEQMTDGEYVINAELPGIDPEKDLDISLENDILTIRAERSESEKAKGHTEFRYGTFTRSVRLPQGAKAEDTRADYKDGILKVTVPMSEKKAGPRTIQVRRS